MTASSRRPTAREKLADWTLAYHVMLEEMELDAPGTIDLAYYAQRTVPAAALAAAILVANAGVPTGGAVAAEGTASGEESLDA